MCVILVCEKSKPKLEMLKKCNNANRDGIGVGYYDNVNKLCFKKGLTLDELWQFTKVTKLPYVIHFRLDSVSNSSKELLHPFPIYSDIQKLEGSDKALLFHNGHINNWDQYYITLAVSNQKIAKQKNWSDTKVLAILCRYTDFNILNFFQSQKFAIMRQEGKKIEVIGSFQKIDGINCSNGFFNLSYPTFPGINSYRQMNLKSKLPKKDSLVIAKNNYKSNYSNDYYDYTADKWESYSL